MLNYHFIREFKSTTSAAETEPTPTGTSGTFRDLCPGSDQVIYTQESV